jgi:hypothetical protein
MRRCHGDGVASDEFNGGVMRYRTLDANGDYSFGRGGANFLVNSPPAVAQAVLTRLLLLLGEWYLDTTEGTPWATQILGEHTQATYDAAIRNRVIGTEGVTDIVSYSSFLSQERSLSVNMTINTVYGQTALVVVL